MHSKIDAILSDRAQTLCREIALETGLNPARSRDLLHEAALALSSNIRAGRANPNDPNDAFTRLDTNALARDFGLRPKQLEAGLRGVWPRLCNAFSTADSSDLGELSTQAVTRDDQPKGKKGKARKVH